MTRFPNHAQIRFHGSLNDFLDPENRDKFLKKGFHLAPSAKDLIEASGVPHVEIYRLKINGITEPLSYNVQDGDALEVFPMEREFAEQSQGTRDLPAIFLADAHLGKLARLLRLIGIDTEFDEERVDKSIIKQAQKEDRAVLTRDIGLLKHGDLEFGHGYWLRSTDPGRQVLEVVEYFGLGDTAAPFSRCMDCNGLLEEAGLEEVAEKVPEKVQAWCDEYQQCNSCGNVYWKGSHYVELKNKVKAILE